MEEIRVDLESGRIVVVAKGHWSNGKMALAKMNPLIDVEKEQVGIEVELGEYLVNSDWWLVIGVQLSVLFPVTIHYSLP